MKPLAARNSVAWLLDQICIFRHLLRVYVITFSRAQYSSCAEAGLETNPFIPATRQRSLSSANALESDPKWGQAKFDGQRENVDLTSVWRRIMRLIIEAHLVDDEGSTERNQLATIDRASTTDPLGMSLAEGKALLAATAQG